MCWKCFLCESVARPGTPLRRHIVYRDVGFPRGPAHAPFRPTGAKAGAEPAVRREIAREAPVCEDCDALLRSGLPEARVRELRPPPVYVPPPPRPPRRDDYRDPALARRVRAALLKVRGERAAPVNPPPAPTPADNDEPLILGQSSDNCMPPSE